MNFLGQYMMHPKETLEEEIRFSFNNRKPLIVFDESGELFRKTAGSAEKAGYDVVRINFANPKESDGWNPFVMFRETMKKQGSAEAIDNVHRFVQNMLNSFHQGRYDMFCSEIEESLLNGLFLYVAFSDNFRGREDKRHLGTAIEIFLNFRTKDGQGLAEPEFFDFIENISDEDLAKADFQMFRKLWGMAGGLQRNIITGLSTQLWFVGGNYGILLSSNDVDFISPSNRPCICYCIYNEEEKNKNFLVNAFYMESLKRLRYSYVTPEIIIPENFKEGK